MFLQIIYSLAITIFIILAISAVLGVPFLQTHLPQAKKMVALAELGPGKTAIDLGSGAGRLLFLVSETGSKAVGYELNPFLFLLTKIRIASSRRRSLSPFRGERERGIKGNVEVICKSLYKADIKNADAVFAFLFPKPMKKLAPKLFSEMKPGAKIISYAFKIEGRTPEKIEEGIYVYKIPNNLISNFYNKFPNSKFQAPNKFQLKNS